LFLDRINWIIRISHRLTRTYTGILQNAENLLNHN